VVRHPPFHPAQTLLFCVTGCHPMWRRSVFDHLGLFDESYVAPGDYEFLLRMIAAGCRLVHVPEVLSLFFQNPVGLSAQKGEPETAVLLDHQRRTMPIERLYGVDPSDAQQCARAYVALGNLAMAHEVPWDEHSHTELPFAIACYDRALASDPGCAEAAYNLAVLHAHAGRTALVGQMLAVLPPALLETLTAEMRTGEPQLVDVDVAPAYERLVYTPRARRPVFRRRGPNGDARPARGFVSPRLAPTPNIRAFAKLL
jgi:hypothetical protein